MSTFTTESISFINHLKFEKNLSAKTIKAYSTDLRQFNEFLQKNNYPIEIDKISKIEIRSFLEFISNLKPKSIKRKIATIKALFNYLEFEDTILINPLRKMKIKIREPKRLPKVMDIGEIKQVLNSAYQKHQLSYNLDSYGYFETLRNVVVLELLFSTGARVSEIADLKTENIQLSTGEISIKGKGDKERVIQICNIEAMNCIKKYFNLFKNEIKLSGGYFLVNRFGNKLSDQSIRGIVKNVCKKTKIIKNITPHVFRHTMATLLLENDVDIRYIQTILGHSSINTTQIYTHVNQIKQRQILKTKHPRKDMIFNNNIASK